MERKSCRRSSDPRGERFLRFAKKKRIDRLLAMSKEYNKGQMYLGILANLAQYRLCLFCFLFYLALPKLLRYTHLPTHLPTYLPSGRYSPFFRLSFIYRVKVVNSYDPILPTYLLLRQTLYP